MNTIKSIFTVLLMLAVLTLLAMPCMAQDLYGQPRTILLAPCPQHLVQSTTDELLTTNNAVDVHGYQGVAQILFWATNTSGSSPKIAAWLEGSNDKTSWYTLTNVASSTKVSYPMTNYWVSGSPGTANQIFVPGTLTTNTAATAGFAGVSLTPAAFTTTANLCTNTAGGAWQFGVPATTLPYWIRLRTQVVGDTSIFVCGGVFIGMRYNTW